MITFLDVLEDFTVHDLVELALREPNQEMKVVDWCDKMLLKLEECANAECWDEDLEEANGDENQLKMNIIYI